MSEVLYWGEGGQYGPYTAQEDGWPNAGEVMRDYREKQGLTAETFALLYSEELARLGKQNKKGKQGKQGRVTGNWILNMEKQNIVPADITRRRIIARLLKVPPILLGLASLEEALSHPIETQTPSAFVHPNPIVPPTLAYHALDLEWYSKEAHILWQLHYAQTAQDALADLLAYTHHLAPLQQASKGNLRWQTSELMNSYYRLAATIQRDRGNFEDAYRWANEGVRFAKEMQQEKQQSVYALQVIAASQYTRGVVNLAWGVFGDHVKQGAVVMKSEKIAMALADFERASKNASLQLKGVICLEMARATGLVATSPTDSMKVLRLLEQAEGYVNRDSHDDFYTQILINGDLKGLDKKHLILGRAKAFLAIQRPGKALDEFDSLELLKDGASHTRRRGWTQLLYAQAAFEIGDYFTATEKAIHAFRDCIEAHSITHLARIQELYGRLLTSPYREDVQVKYLGRLLEQAFSKKH